MKFKLEIKMGNEAMQTAWDIQRALKDVIGKMEKGQTDGSILDDNGNKVGKYEWEY